MPTQNQSEEKNLKVAKIVMAAVTVLLIVLLFTVPLWKSNAAQTSLLSKGVGGVCFAFSFACIAIEKWLRTAFSETVFYLGWFVSVALALLLIMGGGL